MTVSFEQAKQLYICDKCKTERSVVANSGLPKRWCNLTITRTSYDIHDNAAANDTVERDFCKECHNDLVMLINKWREL